MRAVLSVLALCCSFAVFSQTVIDGFEDPEMDARYRDLISTIRCMNCQNQSVADSPAEQAGDIRRLVHDMMVAGRTDGEIVEYLVSRYGDFISYRPPFKPSTWILWAAPALLLAGGAWAFARVVRARMQQPLEPDEAID